MNALRPLREESGAVGIGAIVGGTIASLVLAFFVTVLLPITGGSTAAEAGDPRSYNAQELAGRALYIRESCFACHTQTVRNTYSDSMLAGSSSQEGLYDNEAPNLIGVIRLGPDLTCVGDREDDPNWYVRHLRNPESEREHSTMPEYDYLSNRELQALAAYLLTLTCSEG